MPVGNLQMRSKVHAALVRIGAAVACVAMTAGLVDLVQDREVAGPLIALLSLGLSALGAGAALCFADESARPPDLRETISRTRQQIR